MTNWISTHRKAIVALVGAVATWAVTYYPDNHTVILVVGIVAAVGTGLGVHIVPNTATKTVTRKARAGARK